jgi:hypothetical protein
VIDFLGVYVVMGGICESRSTLGLGYGSGICAVSLDIMPDFGCSGRSCWLPDLVFLGLDREGPTYCCERYMEYPRNLVGGGKKEKASLDGEVEVPREGCAWHEIAEQTSTVGCVL